MYEQDGYIIVIMTSKRRLEDNKIFLLVTRDTQVKHPQGLCIIIPR